VSGLEARFQTRLGEFTLDVEFTAPGRGITALFGPSGSGKTTVLRCAAGLERAAQARFYVDGSCWQDSETGCFLPTHRRPIGYVFQEPSLFAHLSVRRNLEYGLRRIASAERRVAFDQAVEWLGVAPLLDRSPARLSGGERQRVAIARALLTSPSLLLMDEPLAALDARSKAEILPYLERLHAELSIPVLYVTHAPAEVSRLADHLVVFERGRVAAAGPLRELLTRLDVSAFADEDAEVVLDARVAAHDECHHLTEVSVGGQSLWIPREGLSPGSDLRLRIRAGDVSIALDAQGRSSILNRLRARVDDLRASGEGQVLVRLQLEGQPLLARVTARSAAELELSKGLEVFAQIKGVALAG
jgi:molybdate transport system ATP-binding protein